MTRKPQPLPKARRPKAEPAPLTMGQVLGDQLRAVQAERDRRAELDAMGFRPVKSEP